MKGRHEARICQMERDISLAWYSAAFAGAKRLKPLDSYLKALRHTEDESRGGVAVYSALMAMKERGVPMEVRKLN